MGGKGARDGGSWRVVLTDDEYLVLGLCFLPAFLALGIVPVVVGLAGPLLEQR